MDRWATKDTFEREEDEAERLVRPAPKVKPPRHDRRREDTHSDQDPDVAGDSELKGDPDLSLNYKNVGGSILNRWRSVRILARWQRQTDLVRPEAGKKPGSEGEWVSVINKETGEPTRVKEETLKGPDKAKYKLVKEDEKEESAKPEEPSPAEKGQAGSAAIKDQAFFADARTQIEQLTKNDPEFAAVIKDFANPKSGIGHFIKQNPNAPAASFTRGRKLPPGVETVGELQSAMMTAPAPKAKPKTPSEAPVKAPEAEKVHETKPEAEAEAPKAAPEGEKAPESETPKAESEAVQEVTKTVTDTLEKALKEKGEGKLDPQDIGQQIAKAVSESVSKALEEAFAKIAPKQQPKPKGEGAAPPPSREAPAGEEFGGKPKGKGPKAKPQVPVLDREQPTREESARAQQDINDTFPPDIADALHGKDLHPEDVGKLMTAYNTARQKSVRPSDVSNFANKVQSFYTLDPDTVGPPATVNGKPFEKLDPKEQAEAWQDHRLNAVAASIAARESLRSALHTGSGAPLPLAEKLADFMLRTKADDAGADKLADKFYRETLEASGPEPISDSDIKSILKSVKDHPAAKKLAVAYLQANDYQSARERFLNNDSDENISEFDDPKKIAAGVAKASEYLRDRAKNYPTDAKVHDTAAEFRNRVLNRLNTLAPEKYPFVRGRLHDQEAGSYEEDTKVYEKLQKDFEEQKRRAEREVERDKAKAKKKRDGFPLKGEHPHRGPQPGSESDADDVPTVEERLREKGVTEPRKPIKPSFYDWWKGEKTKGQAGADYWKSLFKLFNREKSKKEASSPSERVVRRWVGSKIVRDSSYPGCWTMGQQRQAVYWGVEPYPAGHEGFEPYHGWQQAEACALTEADYAGILTAARNWLKMPVLSVAVEGIVPDTQYRAALDLALRDFEGGMYSVGLHPTKYNELLAKLAGQSPEGTLLTVRTAGVKLGGWSYAIDRMYFLFVEGRRPVPFNIDTIRAINAIWVPVKGDDGEMHHDASVKFVEQKSSGPLTHGQEKLGDRRETRVFIEFPKGTEHTVSKEINALGKRHGFIVEPSNAGYQPKTRKPAGRQAGLESTYGVAPGEVTTMKASAQVRAFATRVASFDPELAYAMVDFSVKLAQDEQKAEEQKDQGQAQGKQAGQVPPEFLEHQKGKEEKKDDDDGQKKEAALRSIIIRTAANHPEAREAFLPILQHLKKG